MSSTEAHDRAPRPAEQARGSASGEAGEILPPEAAPGRAEDGGGTAAPARHGAGQGAGWGTGGRRRGRGWLAAAVVVVLAAAAVGAAAAAGAFRRPGAQASAGNGNGYRTATKAVARRSLTSQTQVSATLGDAGSWTVSLPSGSSPGSSSAGGAGSGSGTFTWLPSVGQVIRQGHRIYDVSGEKTVLLYGTVPAYRDLAEGMTGRDVAELNADLVKLGYATRPALGPRSGWDYYSAETAYAVELLQAKLGLTETGTLTLGQAAFLPGPALITGLGGGAVLGGPAAPGAAVLTASSTTPVVTVELDAAQQSEVKAGDPVSITLPDGSATPGVVSHVSRVASSSAGSSGNSAGGPGGSSNSAAGGSGATITVLVSLTHPKAAGTLNQAPVTVTITTGSVSDALVVPVNALLAQPGGSYAVEVTGPGGHHLVKVVPGLFDDAAGLVQVSGNLTPGQRVVVPGI